MGCGNSKSEIQDSQTPQRTRLSSIPNEMSLMTRSSSVPREGFTQDGKNFHSPSHNSVENTLLNNFKVSRADFIRSNSTRIHETYRILSPPIGKGLILLREYNSSRSFWRGQKSHP
jgi:hypothetical protein